MILFVPRYIGRVFEYTLGDIDGCLERILHFEGEFVDGFLLWSTFDAVRIGFHEVGILFGGTLPDIQLGIQTFQFSTGVQQ